MVSQLIGSLIADRADLAVFMADFSICEVLSNSERK